MLNMCGIFHKTLDIMENYIADNNTPGDNCMHGISSPSHMQCFHLNLYLKQKGPDYYNHEVRLKYYFE